MTKGSDFENPLQKAVQLGTIGTKTKQPEDAPPQAPAEQQSSPARRQAVTPLRPGGTDSEKQPERKQQTIYLPRQLARTLKHHAVDLDRDISSVVQAALEEYFDRLGIPR